MEIKSISRPGAEADDEEDPVFGRELSHQTEGILNGIGVSPFAMCLAMLVGDNNTLIPDEEVTERLFGSCEDALSERVGGFAVLDLI